MWFTVLRNAIMVLLMVQAAVGYLHKSFVQSGTKKLDPLLLRTARGEVRKTLESEDANLMN